MKKGESCGVKIKEKILKIALKLYIERGFEEVSINELIKEVGINKINFYEHFNSKDQLIYEAIEMFIFPYLDNIIRNTDENNGFPRKRLLKIFQQCSEIESYLKNNFGIVEINHKLITFLTIEGVKKYEPITKYISNFNTRLLKKIEYIIEEGKKLGEISSIVNSKSIAINTLSSLQSAIVLWIMNENINITMLFGTIFIHLWNDIKLS